MTSTASVPLRSVSRLSGLSALGLRSNWRLPKVKLPHLLVRGLGRRSLDLTTRLVEAVQREKLTGSKVGWVAEANPPTPHGCALRFTRDIAEGHRVTTDVVVQSQATDVYVRFESNARTRIAWLRWLVMGGLFLVLWGGLYALYFTATDAYNAVAQKIARQRSADPMIGPEVILDGWHLDPVTGQPVKGRRITVRELYDLDPEQFRASIMVPSALIAILVGFVVSLIPKTVLRHPCRWLGWPTPDEFQNAAMAHCAWVHRVLSDVLITEFGIGRDAIIELQG